MLKNNLILFLLTSIISLSSFAQKDTLLELGFNNKLKAFYNSNKDNPESIFNRKQQNNKALLTLPFLDDFSQEHIYPDQNLWMDFNVHVNCGFADEPKSYGVVTFDGLDSIGNPYDFSSSTSYGPADTLTSHPINTTAPVDSLYLSFYYQPQGNGNKPETKDSLRLEFFRLSDSSWVRMWGVEGSANQPFQQVMIPVDTSFQNNAFQFRFINWATLSGNVDHWNLDYVYLNEGRNYADTALNDVALITNNFTLLSEYTSMPWEHYVVDSLSNMALDMPVTYKNNHSATYGVFYKYQVIDNNGSGPVLETYPSTTSAKNAPAYSALIEPQAVYNVSPTFINDFYYPPSNDTTKVFQIKNYFTLASPDFNTKNDTVNSYQVFGNYYAYDDGSAEVGYGVQGIGSKLAHEFSIKKADTLTGFDIYFSPIAVNHSAQTFRLKVWSSLNPETEIYSQNATQFTSPIYSNRDEFLKYTLDAPLFLNPGTYYIGWEKISQEFLNVGWDVNNDNSSKVHFNAVGVWQTATYPGSLMLRPVFRNFSNPQVSIDEEKETENDFKLFPNPAGSSVNFKINSNVNYKVEMIDINGKVLIQTTSSLTNRLNTSEISNGIYLIRFTNISTQHTTHKKVIIAK